MIDDNDENEKLPVEHPMREILDEYGTRFLFFFLIVAANFLFLGGLLFISEPSTSLLPIPAWVMTTLSFIAVLISLLIFVSGLLIVTAFNRMGGSGGPGTTSLAQVLFVLLISTIPMLIVAVVKWLL